ncbi:MAG: glycosyltransferase [bacterium]|nr:glycosyltransferase [bacterium]
MRVLIQQPRLPHYRVPLFNRLVQMHGWAVTLAFTPRIGAGESGLEVEKASLFECVHLPLRQFTLGGVKLNYQRGLLSLLRARRWDAFFWEGTHANLSGYLAARLCRRRGIPSICWTKGYFTSENAVRRGMSRFMTRAAHAFLPYGDSTHSFLAAHGVRPEQIARAYNTVDVEAIAAQEETLRQRGMAMLKAIGWSEARPLIACVGRLVPQKRMQDAILALATMTRGGLDAYLLIVGDGPERASLERLAEELGVEPRVHFTGRVPENDDSAALAVADVAVFPGAHGLAINQAMALGAPVVAADLPGPDGEMVRHEETGWRYPLGTAEMMVETLRSAIECPQRKTVTENARAEILQKRSLTRYAQAFHQAVQIAQRERGADL